MDLAVSGNHYVFLKHNSVETFKLDMPFLKGMKTSSPDPKLIINVPDPQMENQEIRIQILESKI